MNSKKKEAQPKESATISKKPGIFMPRVSDYTTRFLKDLSKIKHSGAHDLTRLVEVIRLLINNEAPLPAEWLDHDLKGEFSGLRELHVKGDLLLIYELGDHPKGIGTVVFTRLGSHSELFG